MHEDLRDREVFAAAETAADPEQFHQREEAAKPAEPAAPAGKSGLEATIEPLKPSPEATPAAPAAKNEPAPRKKTVGRRILRFRASPLAYVLGALAGSTILATSLWTVWRFEAIRIQDQAAKDAALLREKGIGDLGAGEALSRELATDRYLDHFDHSCKQIGATSTDRDGVVWCIGRPVLRDLTAPEPDQGWFHWAGRMVGFAASSRFALPSHLNLAENDIIGGHLSKTDAASIDLSGSKIVDSDLRDVDWGGSFNQAQFEDSKLDGAHLEPSDDVDYAYVSGSVSNLVISDDLHCWYFYGSYAWADAPPRQDPALSYSSLRSLVDPERLGTWGGTWGNWGDGGPPAIEQECILAADDLSFQVAVEELVGAALRLTLPVEEYFPPVPLSRMDDPDNSGVTLCAPPNLPLEERPALNAENCTPVDAQKAWRDLRDKNLARTDLHPLERALFESWGEQWWTARERAMLFSGGPRQRFSRDRGWK